MSLLQVLIAVHIVLALYIVYGLATGNFKKAGAKRLKDQLDKIGKD